MSWAFGGETMNHRGHGEKKGEHGENDRIRIGSFSGLPVFFCALGLLLALPLRGQASSPHFWKADPHNSRLELLAPLGGWHTAGPGEISVKLIDPTDPRPPGDPGLDYWDRWQARRMEEAAALNLRTLERFEGEPGLEGPRREQILAWLRDRDSEAGPVSAAELSFAARWLKAEGEARMELEAASRSRRRTLLAWFNGEALIWELEVNREHSLSLSPIQGENRLEILDPATDQHLVRTWWCGRRGPRLRVLAREQGVRWPSWNLDVLEPSGKLASGVRDFEKTHPSPGTYTLRWDAGAASRWWSPEDAAPRRVEVDVILDGGTDQERRWRFESLILPGAGSVLIGSFDVED